MKNLAILTLFFCLPMFLPAQKKRNYAEPGEVKLLTKEDHVLTVWIPLSEQWPKFVPQHLKHILKNTPAFNEINQPLLASLPLNVLDEIKNNRIKALAYDWDSIIGYKYSSLTREMLRSYIDDGIQRYRNIPSYIINPEDSFNYYISRIVEVNLRVRDSLGTIVYTPMSLTLIWEDLLASSVNFCNLDLNQTFFNRKNENQESINDLLRGMKYEYYPVEYLYKRGRKTYEVRITSYDQSMAVKYAIIGGGTEIFNNKKQSKYNSTYITQLQKERIKANKRWIKAQSDSNQ